jgi:hypothetical protein
MNATNTITPTSAASEPPDGPSNTSSTSPRQLPRVAELLRGCPFLDENRDADAAAFADETIRRIGARERQNDILLSALRKLMEAPTSSDFLVASAALERHVQPGERESGVLLEAAARCCFYGAVSGDADAVRKVAAHAVMEAYSSGLDPNAVRSQVAGAVAWILAAAGQWPPPAGWTRKTAAAFVAAVDADPGPGRGMVRRMLQSRATLLEGQPEEVLADGPGIAAAPETGESTIDPVDPLPVFGHPTPVRSDQATTGVVVFREVGNAVGDVGARVAREFQPLLRVPLPLAPLPKISAVERELLGAFPHAEAVVSTVLGDLVSASHVRLRPTAFVGSTGIGKSRFAVMLGELLGVPTEVFPCSSVGDALPGMSRRWTTGEPSIPVAVIRAHRHASPAIVLDDIDTADDALSAALLGMLEAQSARTWFDPYVEAPVDLSHILWIATARSLDGIPRALRERLRLIAFPSPDADHLATLADTILNTLTAERRMDSRWAPPLTGAERQVLGRYWRGGSLRYLTRLVEGILAARDRNHALH